MKFSGCSRLFFSRVGRVLWEGMVMLIVLLLCSVLFSFLVVVKVWYLMWMLVFFWKDLSICGLM